MSGDGWHFSPVDGGATFVVMKAGTPVFFVARWADGDAYCQALNAGLTHVPGSPGDLAASQEKRSMRNRTRETANE